MAFTRIAALLHAALSDVSANQHHTATVAGDLNLADMAERLHASLTSVDANDHRSSSLQAAMEAETVESSVVTPSAVNFSPGVAKVWVKWEQTGANSIQASHNMTSVTDGGANGDTDHLYDDDFSGDEYVIIAGCGQENGLGVAVNPVVATIIAAGVTTITTDIDGVDVDATDNFLVAYGDQ